MRLLPSARILSDREPGALTRSALTRNAGATGVGRCTARAGLALGAVTVMALAGCGVVHATGAASKATGPTGTDVTSARPPLGPQQRAVADADAILASFAVPQGAQKIAAAPDVDSGALKTSIQIPGTPDLVDKADWWLAPGKPTAVLAWEAKHVSHRFSFQGTGSVSNLGNDTESLRADMFTLPDITGVLDSRELVVQVVPDGDKTAIRVDAQVTWQPARPAIEKIPATAKAVTISLDLGMNQGSRKPPKPVTITDPAKVKELRTLINSLPLTPPGVFHCPLGFGDSLGLTFRARPGAAALAVATVLLSGCAGVDLTIGGKSQPVLAGLSGTQIFKIAGLSWKIPTLGGRP